MNCFAFFWVFDVVYCPFRLLEFWVFVLVVVAVFLDFVSCRKGVLLLFFYPNL